MTRYLTRLTVCAVLLISASALHAATFENWSGYATVHGHQVPVHLRLSSSTHDGAITGEFVNGKQVNPSSSGVLAAGHLALTFDYYARKLEGEVKGDSFKGTYSGARIDPVAIELQRDAQATAAKAGGEKAPTTILGDWEIAVQSSKGESAWTLRVSALPHDEIEAVILRIDGDTSGLYGSWKAADGDYEVSHFSASGPALYTLHPQDDGTLLVTNPLREGQQWTARRPAEARKENLAPPTRTTEQTGVVDPQKPFAFSAPDVNGKLVSSSDAQFHGKVVIVAIGGSWCPNCHDEAPLLVELYNRYHARGLEIVNLSFEEDDQLKDPQRLRAFIAKYNIPYTVLLAGTPDQLNERLPQGKNLNCWPTSFFINREGSLAEVHAGFAGPETGNSHAELAAEMNAEIAKLLEERTVASR